MTIKFTSLSYLQLTDHAVGEVLTVADLHARKAEMARQADAFIALPGLYIYIYMYLYSPLNLECLCFDLTFGASIYKSVCRRIRNARRTSRGHYMGSARDS